MSGVSSLMNCWLEIITVITGLVWLYISGLVKLAIIIIFAEKEGGCKAETGGTILKCDVFTAVRCGFLFVISKGGWVESTFFLVYYFFWERKEVKDADRGNLSVLPQLDGEKCWIINEFFLPQRRKTEEQRNSRAFFSNEKVKKEKLRWSGLGVVVELGNVADLGKISYVLWWHWQGKLKFEIQKKCHKEK